MRLAVAIAGGLVGGAVLAWWLAEDDTKPRAGNGPPAAGATAPATTHAQPLYRWRDARGVLQVTQQPPEGRPYERVEISEQRNIVELDIAPVE